VGDSLTAGFGLSPEESYVAVLERSLKAKGHVLSLRNAGVSGDTSAGVKRRLPWLLKRPPEVMFLCIGANDGMRGQPTEALAQNLKDIVSSAREAGVKRVILMGMRLPPNYGEAYVKRFEAVYPAVARELGVPLMPFLLEGVGGEPSLNLSDGIHPNKAGHERVASSVERFLTEQRLLAELLGGALEPNPYEPR
jgi:acyl-CoA thioesterase-1